ncbi:MAG: RNA polymerase sigma factor SigZ [Chloroflexi bacterium]|nr:RNA polymerase sigma factor SigZ [Chloroflexota bacterium]MCI0581146.1 RNA polymerase sigma factor SigZ [Chloroflexota bacterium]MCI0645384.1 RNA polymerase sigma factor SigZ [Chloroflexota bacterium]MCI0727185.1 RNA polymerase sigma factor SigZ [Chloroflexota bacterium]
MIHTETLWTEYNEQLRQFIARRVSDAQAVDDILQETFLKIHTGLARLRESDRLQSWIYQIVRHAIIDYYRTRSTTVELPEAIALPEEAEEEILCELEKSLQRLADTLPDKYRQAVMWDSQGVPQKEIAGRLGLSLSGAKSRVQRGREMLKQSLLACCHLEFDRRGKVLDCHPSCDCCSGNSGGAGCCP